MNVRATWVWLTALAAFGCGDAAPPPVAPTSSVQPTPTATSTPTVTATATASTTPAASATPSAPPIAALKYPPKTGYLERAADGTCGWWAGLYWCPQGSICKTTPPAQAVRCPRSIQGTSKGPAAKLPSENGWLEREVDGTCWWSKEAPAECTVDAPCAPLPPSHQVACHP